MDTKKFHVLYISIIIVLVLAMGAEFYYFHKKTEQIQKVRVTGEAMMRQGMRGGSGGMVMVAATPPAISDQQTEQLAMGTKKRPIQKVFNITGGNFYFVPNKITVNKGDQVTFVMTNAGGAHDIIIDELGVNTPVVHTAEAATVTFTATKTGSFTYYCDVKDHKEKGMTGTLIVQ